MIRGDVWWLESPAEKRRPVLVMTRSRHLPLLARVTVAEITTRRRGHPDRGRLSTRTMACHGLA